VCGTFETCKGPSEDYAAKFFCNKVTDFGGAAGPKGAIEKACIGWKANTFCEYNTALIIWIIIGIIVVLGVVGFVIYYFMAKKAADDEAKQMAMSGSRKGKYQRLRNKRSRLYKFGP
jgi:hypothetical protein